jgi:cellobiose phosphorylase
MGYSIFEAQRGTLRSSLTCFVPLDSPCEIWLLRLENQGTAPRHLQIFTYLEWLLGAAPDWHREFHRTFIDTRYDAKNGVLLASKVLWELPVPSKVHWTARPYVTFLSSSLKPVGFDADKRDFLGRNGTLRRPSAMVSGRSQNHAGRWGDPIGSLQLELMLTPGETREIVFTLGAADSIEQAVTLVNSYKGPATAHTDLKTAREYWQSLTDQLVIETPDPALNVMGNGWLQYQAISGRLKGRTAYYQTGGAYGFRDQLQDSLIWLLLRHPEKTLDQIRLHAAHRTRMGLFCTVASAG